MLNKKTGTILILGVLVAVGIAATTPPHNSFKNLKVLPQDISEQQLDSLMDSYNKALKVSCDFCHSKVKDITGIIPEKDAPVDFALDNQMKEEARRMIKLTIEINKTYFKFDTTGRADHLLNVITCNTCHRGNPFPAHE